MAICFRDCADKLRFARIILITVLASIARTGNAQEGIQTIKPVENGIVWAVAIAPDNKTFAAAQLERVLIYETASKKLLKTIRSKSKRRIVDGSEDWINGVDFSPDGKLLAGARADGTVSLWDTTTFKERVRLNASENWIIAVRFSLDGRLLATTGRDRQIRLWDVNNKSVKVSLTGHTDWIHCITFSTDGRLLASGSEDGSVRLWDTASGEQIHMMKASSQAVKSVAFSSDGKILLSGCQKNKIDIWDVSTGEHKGVLRGHKSTVQSIQFLEDDRTIISASLDGTVRAWDLNKQIEIGAISTAARYNSIQSMDMSEDKKFVVCGELYSAIRLVQVEQFLKSR